VAVDPQGNFGFGVTQALAKGDDVTPASMSSLAWVPQGMERHLWDASRLHDFDPVRAAHSSSTFVRAAGFCSGAIGRRDDDRWGCEAHDSRAPSAVIVSSQSFPKLSTG
jgi:hypothetical protein